MDLHNLRVYLRPPGTGRRVDVGPGLRGAGLAEAPLLQSSRVDVEINGAAGQMIVDTGSFVATLDRRFAEQNNLPLRGSFVGTVDVAGVRKKSELTFVQSFKIGSVQVSVPDLRLSNYAGFVTSSGKVIGLLGMDILGRNGTIIDYGQQKLYFLPQR